jgi:3-hydroxyisobutyrate dehydrogenase-like beta-hydroxyacid dehydrogenase
VVSTATPVGFIGLGTMGVPMARRLLGAGFPVFGYNRSRERMDALAREGLAPCSSPGEVAERAEVIVTALPTEAAVREVADGILASARSGQVLVEHSTVAPHLSRDLAARARDLGVDYLDAPVSGGPARAEDGSLTVMVGGDREVLDRVRPVLAAYGDPIRHCGDVGSGQAVKLVNQLLVAIHTAASAEAAAFATSLGLDLNLVSEVVGTSFGGSTMLTRNLPRIAAHDFSPATPVRLISKDLSIIGREASSHSVALRLAAVAGEVFAETARRGYDGEDMAAVSRLWADRDQRSTP